jgi:hypothetical protein
LQALRLASDAVNKADLALNWLLTVATCVVQEASWAWEEVRDAVAAPRLVVVDVRLALHVDRLA